MKSEEDRKQFLLKIKEILQIENPKADSTLKPMEFMYSMVEGFINVSSEQQCLMMLKKFIDTGVNC